MDECTVTVTALAPLPTLNVDDSALAEDPETVTYAVDEGTVTVTALLLSSLVAGDVVSALDCVIVDKKLVGPADEVASTVLEAARLVLSPGTSPNTLTTLLLAKHPICTPLVVFSGMTAQTSPPSHPVTSHLPSLVHPAYSASMQPYWPLLHAEEDVRLVNSALRAVACARLLA